MTLAMAVPGLWLTGYGSSKTLLSPKDPTTLSIWHVYGEQADSPMNRLLTERRIFDPGGEHHDGQGHHSHGR